jgi:7,8-dihydropterin-6-yl-methyl-4-(beta-D-ribofuranosyl)aminobenzene 5'-phosphate synthase
MDRRVSLKEVDDVEVISLIDNTVDFTSTVQKKEVQKVREWTKKHSSLPFAEHGFSVLIKIFSQENHHTILFDTGLSPEGVMTNAIRLGIDLTEVECIVLSHGHYDHYGGLVNVLKAINRKDLPIIVHDDMFKTRGVINPDGTMREYPRFPSKDQVAPARYLRTKQPYLLHGEKLLVSGEIPRKTDFEKGFLRHYAYSGGKWLPDPWIWDDQAIILNVKHRGLIIISGCAHAGIINTTLFAQQTTGVAKIYAIMGGFHLAGKDCETRISQTVKMLQQLNPEIIVPMHCTSWRGKFAISKAMPQAFIWNGVGHLYRFS